MIVIALVVGFGRSFGVGPQTHPIQARAASRIGACSCGVLSIVSHTHCCTARTWLGTYGDGGAAPFSPPSVLAFARSLLRSSRRPLGFWSLARRNTPAGLDALGSSIYACNPWRRSQPYLLHSIDPRTQGACPPVKAWRRRRGRSRFDRITSFVCSINQAATAKAWPCSTYVYTSIPLPLDPWHAAPPSNPVRSVESNPRHTSGLFSASWPASSPPACSSAPAWSSSCSRRASVRALWGAACWPGPTCMPRSIGRFNGWISIDLHTPSTIHIHVYRRRGPAQGGGAANGAGARAAGAGQADGGGAEAAAGLREFRNWAELLVYRNVTRAAARVK